MNDVEVKDVLDQWLAPDHRYFRVRRGGLKTRGVHTDQLAAAIQVTEHALNMMALRHAPPPGPGKR